MKQRHRPHRWFTMPEIAYIRMLAKEGNSQSRIASLFDRNPGTIANMAKRYGIQFNKAPNGRPKGSGMTIAQRRVRRNAQSRTYRRNRSLSDLSRTL